MKTRLTLSILLFSTMLMAQVGNQPTIIPTSGKWETDGQPFGVVPKSFSYNGTNRVYLLTENQVNIFSNTFTPVRSFGFTPTTCADESHILVTERCYANGKVVNKDNQSYTDGPLPISYEKDGETITTDQVPSDWTLADIIAYLSNHQSYVVASTTTKDGNTIYLSNNEDDYFKYDAYARLYPEKYWALENNQLIWHRDYYYECNTFPDTWTEYSREENISTYNIGLGMFDYDDGEFQYLSGENVGLLTQTLFNTDEQYEFIHFVAGEYTTSNHNVPEPTCVNCDCNEEYKTRSIYYRATCAGFEVLSETGTILCSITFPASFKVYLWHGIVNLIKLDGQYYICVSGKISEGESGILCYRIDRSGSGASVQQVSDPQPVSGSYKYLHRGNVYIQQDTKTYTIQGHEAR